MSFVYTPAAFKIARGELAWHAASLRALAVMSNTTADTDRDAATLSAITTLDEFDGTGYSRDADLGPGVVQDDANNRAEYTTTPISFGATVAAGSRAIVGVVIYFHVTGLAADDWPIFFIDQGGFPVTPGGGSLTVTPNAEGLAQLASA